VNSSDPDRRFTAVNDFYRVRSQADLREIIARFSGKSTELLSYEEVRQKLRAYKGSEQGLKDIPLNAIIGSVGRYSDFTRDFLPKSNVNRDRWASIKLASEGLYGLPPIEVYQLGEVYFVIDGNHRVSVARQNGMKEIAAYVTEVKSKVSLSPDVKPDELILKAEYVQFLEQTGIDSLRPDAILEVSSPGQYPILEEHIDVHRHYMGIEQEREIPYSEAVEDWYDHIYMPVIHIIRESGILRYFPQRTETDLYLWISKYRNELEDQLGWHIRPESALLDLSSRHTPEGKSIFKRAGTKLLELTALSTLEPGPEAGNWRIQFLISRKEGQIFSDILVPLDGKTSGWIALSQAAVIAKRERAALLGLHVVSSEDQIETPEVAKIREEFEQRCTQEGIHGHLAVEAGGIAELITTRASLVDLVVTSLMYPPASGPFARLDSGFRELIQRTPRPVLAVPQNSTSLDSALLAYDGSPKADEALYIAASMAGAWNMSLKVVTVFEGDKVEPETLMRARVYLDEQGITADYSASKGPIAATILDVAEESRVNLIITGGYGLNPVLELVFGSTLDHVLRSSHLPVLICR
jgi:nucleotide-binding universal stress UspA family protein